MAIRILIADDHQLFREGLMNLLTDTSKIEVIAQAENGKEAIEKARELIPDIVIMDIGMPVINGIEATEILQKELPEIKVIAISMHSDKHYVRGMLEAGAKGYLSKSCTYNQLIVAINAVHLGKKYLSEKITEVVLHDYIGNNEDIPDNDIRLSKRESEILKLFAEGKTTREISEIIYVSIKTVGTHKQHILKKLDLKSTTDIVKYALKKGIITLE